MNTEARKAKERPEPTAAVHETLTAVSHRYMRVARRPGTRFGRYVVVSELGEGAMGVVLEAYDPQLDRSVALKLLRSDYARSERARARFQREARALGSLNHVNVVGVHDVGIDDDHLFIAMELVPGQTLWSWMNPLDSGTLRPWREVVRVFEAAGRGLAAAHDAKIIHRDFKPENVMLGADGRVRVMDFGLARADDDGITWRQAEPADDDDADTACLSLTRTGVVVGTPGYMSPEQFSGRPVTPRSDQFSFCVAFYEALHGDRPFLGNRPASLADAVGAGEVRQGWGRAIGVPAWLQELILRGLSVAPDDRFPSMHALLGALAEGGARRRRRRHRWALGAAVAVAAGVVQYPRYEMDRRADACKSAGAEIEQVWSTQTRAALQDRLSRSTEAGAHAGAGNDLVLQGIDQYAETWRSQAEAACEHTTIHQRWDASLLDRAQWCLEDRRLELSALVTQLGSADAEVLRNATPAVASLQPLDVCGDEGVLQGMVEPPPLELRSELTAIREQMASAATQEWMGSYESALEIVRELGPRAESLSWAPMVAKVNAAEGELLAGLGAFAEAEPHLVDAYLEAVQSGSWDVAADASMTLATLMAQDASRHVDARRWASHSGAAAGRLGDSLGLREATRRSVEGAIDFEQGNHDRARAAFERALAIRERVLGPDAMFVASSLNDLGVLRSTMGDLEESQRLHTRALKIWRRTLGSEHALTARSAHNLGVILTDREEFTAATLHLEEALAVWGRTLGSEHPFVSLGRRSLASALLESGDYEQAHVQYERVLAMQRRTLGPEHPDTVDTLSRIGRVLLRRGNLQEARRVQRQALELLIRVRGPEHWSIAKSLDDLAELDRQGGALGLAKTRYERSMSLRERTLGPEHPAVAVSLLGLGTVLAEQGQYRAALEALERAVEIQSSPQIGPAKQARGLFAYARVLWDASPSSGGDGSRARQLAERARAVHARSDSPRSRASLLEIDRWLAHHGRS